LTGEEAFKLLCTAINAIHEIKRSKVTPKALMAYVQEHLDRSGKMKRGRIVYEQVWGADQLIRQRGDNLAEVLRRFFAPLVELSKQLKAERKQKQAERKQAEAEQVANVIPFPDGGDGRRHK
jgi:hypothetical protein